MKRPQSLFPLSSFDDLTQDRTKEIASHIYKSIGEINKLVSVFPGLCICSLNCVVTLSKWLWNQGVQTCWFHSTRSEVIINKRTDT